ncbi:MAG: aminotransferase class V-fold PLP-dependent enzyme [Nakamurella sp.]
MTDAWARRATDLDDADPLAAHTHEFLVGENSDVVAYLDGNSLGRPLRATVESMSAFIHDEWAGRLIRGWTDGWLDRPMALGDRLGELALGAAPGQVVLGDSTTVWLYKLARAGVAHRPGRSEIVVDTDNFPTDRYVMDGIAAELGMTVRWVDTDPELGLTPELLAPALGLQTALVVFSHVAYRSGYLADARALTEITHRAGGLVLADLSHSVGSVPVELDAWGIDLATGCGYKYLNGGPGAPAFGYVRAEHQASMSQPIWGWLGRKDAFDMAAGYVKADGIRAFVSGTPPILGLVPLATSLEQLGRATMAAVRAKSQLLTTFAVDLSDDWLAPLGVRLASPREPAARGGHITLQRPGFRMVTDQLWDRGVIPDYRNPDAIRIGLAPLSTTFAEVHRGLAGLRDAITDVA